MNPRSLRGLVLVAVASALSTGCGSYVVRKVPAPPKVETSVTNGEVCVARLDDTSGAAVPVWDNAMLVGASTNSSHFCWQAGAGRHYLASELLVTAELAIEVKAAATTWVLLETDTAYQQSAVGSRGYRAGRRKESVRLVRVDEEQGETWRAKTARIELVDVPADQRPPTRSPVPAWR